MANPSFSTSPRRFDQNTHCHYRQYGDRGYAKGRELTRGERPSRIVTAAPQAGHDMQRPKKVVIF
jgi:hypothetical protein